MVDKFSRTELIFGKEAMERLKNARVAVFGIGGVGGYTVEALARSGVGALDLIDNDKVSVTNINRQIIATTKNVGQYKVDVAKQRVSDINPNCCVRTYKTFFLPETKDEFDFSQYDYAVDAIDTVSGKKEIILCAKAANVPVISSMGAGNKIDPTAFEVADIYETSVCPLARVMRGICRKNGIDRLKVVYSREKPIKPNVGAAAVRLKESEGAQKSEMSAPRRDMPGSAAFVPSVAGLIIAGEVIKDLIGIGEN